MTIKDAENSFSLAQREIWNLRELLKVLELAALEQEQNKKASFEWLGLLEVVSKQLASVMPLLAPVETYLCQASLAENRGKEGQPAGKPGRAAA